MPLRYSVLVLNLKQGPLPLATDALGPTNLMDREIVDRVLGDTSRRKTQNSKLVNLSRGSWNELKRPRAYSLTHSHRLHIALD